MESNATMIITHGYISSHENSFIVWSFVVHKSRKFFKTLTVDLLLTDMLQQTASNQKGINNMKVSHMQAVISALCTL